MQILEYRVKIPTVSINDYNFLLMSAVASENTNIVTILQSGESDYANLPSRNSNKLHSGIQRTVKEYKLPTLFSKPINVKSFITKDTSKHNINSNISVTSKCSNIDNIDNIFSLPESFVSSRVVEQLDLANPDVWNFTSPIINPIISLPSGLPVPSETPSLYVYILFMIHTPIIEEIINPNLFKAYIILLHKKIISLTQ